jgi:hypothetical protein
MDMTPLEAAILVLSALIAALMGAVAAGWW